jgi:GT2 family glycosyltransferase
VVILPLIYIILINYNGYRDTIECIQSLSKINYKNFKIIIVDNASTNNSLDYLNEYIENCIIIQSKENLGFAGGNNLGIEYAIKNGAEYVLLLNNDTIVEHNFLNKMTETFNISKNIGVVGCKIKYYEQKNRIWYGGGRINWFKFIGEHYGMREIDKGQYDGKYEIEFMTGCCMLISREVIKKVGLLANEYFMYFEDVDYCVKVKDGGFRIYYNPEAVIYHKVGIASGGEESSFSIKWCTRNRIIFMNKYENRIGKLYVVISKIFFYSTRCIKYLQYVLKGQKNKSNALIEGIKLGIQYLN